MHRVCSKLSKGRSVIDMEFRFVQLDLKIMTDHSSR